MKNGPMCFILACRKTERKIISFFIYKFLCYSNFCWLPEATLSRCSYEICSVSQTIVHVEVRHFDLFNCSTFSTAFYMVLKITKLALKYRLFHRICFCQPRGMFIKPPRLNINFVPLSENECFLVQNNASPTHKGDFSFSPFHTRSKIAWNYIS